MPHFASVRFFAGFFVTTADFPLNSPVPANLGTLHRLLVATRIFYYTSSCVTFRFGSWWSTILSADLLPTDPPPSSGYIIGTPPPCFDIWLNNTLRLNSLIVSISCSLFVFIDIDIMSQPSCYIGVAFHNFASFPTQWALVLSEDPQFMGPGWGSSPAETVTGVGISWVWFARSPAALNPSGLFMGVAYVAQVPMSVNDMKALISSSNRASAEDRAQVQDTDDIPWGTEKYVVLALLRLHEGRYLRLPRVGRGILAHFIGGRLRDLYRVQCTPGGDVYPVVSIDSGSISFGHSAHTWR
jgi:hypothetical protein